jgi:nicotinamide/nicotinate riboside kinase
MDIPKEPKALLLAISGPSCSGKTTLSRMLRDELSPHAIIIHQDDFYYPDHQIPTVRTSDGRELQDWDCCEAIDFDALEDMLRHVKATGSVKDEFKSKEDQNPVGEVHVNWDEVRKTTSDSLQQVVEWTKKTKRKIVIVDGFLLFAEGLENMMELFDIKLLLTVDYETMKRRREARKGYMTIEGFWEDPPGYVDDIVWPNYVKDHKFLYQARNIDHGVDEDICQQLGIHSRPPEDMDNVTNCFIWAVSRIVETFKSSDK